jgi:hypothetical protein
MVIYGRRSAEEAAMGHDHNEDNFDSDGRQ